MAIKPSGIRTVWPHPRSSCVTVRSTLRDRAGAAGQRPTSAGLDGGPAEHAYRTAPSLVRHRDSTVRLDAAYVFRLTVDYREVVLSDGGEFR